MESGNHRIQVAIERGYTHLPCALCLFDLGIVHEGNGIHTFNYNEYINKNELLKNYKPIMPIYISPKNIFKFEDEIIFLNDE